MDLIPVLITGLFAGGLSCAAVQGGLLAGMITRQNTTVYAAPEPASQRRSFGARVGDDLAPVGAFLAGKMLSHTLLGAALGALGSVVQLSVSARVGLQIAAGVLIIAFGLAQLRVPGFRRIVIAPPTSWTRLVRRRARSQDALAPAMLGVATVLLPCGVTLSVEALALASGSWWRGAIVMAVFVAGTAPLFAVVGYVARKAATAWQGRLIAATGVAVIALGVLTVNGGLEITGSPLSGSRIVALLSETDDVESTATTVSAGRQEVLITATDSGYSPQVTAATAGIPTTLVVRSDGAAGCVRSFVIGDLQTVLPENGDTRIDLGTPSAGTVRYACGMGMFVGAITLS